MTHDKGDLLGLGKSHPENEDKLEGVVEGEPVHGADSALEDAKKHQYLTGKYGLV
jgi:hypothetical protein